MGQLPPEKIHREVLIRIPNAQTDESFGCKPSERSTKDLLDLGIVIINKPSGPTSHMVSAYAQDAISIKKAGHSGTLDPKVTGVLPIALGRGTRALQALLPAGKEYVCLCHLHKELDEDTVREAVVSFVGKNIQLPPIKSAVKREKRTRTIYYIEIIEVKGRDVLFRVGCEGGTYIRRLCDDIGVKLKVGAHMAALVRTKAGPFKDSDMVTLQDLRDAYKYHTEGNDKFLRKIVHPIEDAVAHLGFVMASDGAISSICHGRDLMVPGVAKVSTHIKKGDLVAVKTLKGELVALGEARMETEVMARNEKGIAVNVKKVFMKIGTYPRLEYPSDDKDQTQ